LFPDQPAAIEDVLRIEAVADPLTECGKAVLLRMEHIDIAPYLFGRPYQRRVTPGGLDAPAHPPRVSLRIGRQCSPDQAPTPVVDHGAPDVARQPLAFGQQQYRAPVEGADLSLTIDAAIQRMAEDELARTISEQGALGGTILVMDPNTGAILASASAPSYDPNAFNRADPQSYLNPAVSATYEPGSTFKIFTMASGLQTGGITP